MTSSRASCAPEEQKTAILARLDDLEDLLKLCRKYGVAEISLDGAVIKLGDEPPSAPRRRAVKGKEQDPDPNIDPLTGLTHEELMMLSAPEPPE